MSPQGLLERDRELAEIDACIAAAAAEEGSFLVLEGRSGMGKSTLLSEVRERAAAVGLATCWARGSELEGEFAFGVVRQLFEPAIAALSVDDRAHVFEGAAALAEPVLDTGREPAAGGQFAALHGLYWLAANLSARSPLLLAVDDAHWSDAASLRWLAYLLNRLEGLPMLVAIASRPPQSGSPGDLLATILAHPGVRILPVGALGESSVAALVRTTLGADPDPTFTAACRRATAGNPLVLNELLRQLRAEAVAPTGAEAAGLERAAPEGIARRVLRDLGSLGADAASFASALAVTGDGTELRLIARLADLEVDRAVEAADALLGADLIAPGRPPRFAHPLLRRAVYDGLLPATRQKLHRQAAGLLHSEGEEPEAVAAHLLRCEAGQSAQTVEWLRAAAPSALRRRAPEAAAAYLRRALAEDTEAVVRRTVLTELGRAELAAGSQSAVAHLRQSLPGTTDPRARGAILRDLAVAVFLQNDEAQCLDFLVQAIQELQACEPDTATRLECIVIGMGVGNPRLAPSLGRHYQRLRELARSGSSNAELARVTLASLLSWRDGNREEAGAWVGGGFDYDALFDGRPLDTIPVMWSAWALLAIEEYHRAADWCETVIRRATAEGYPSTVVTGLMFKGYAQGRMGLLAEAEADVTAALEMSRGRFPHLVPVLGAAVADIRFDRGPRQAAYEAIESISLAPGIVDEMRGATVREIRGRLRCARGWRERGVEDLRASGRLCEVLRLRNPSIWSWRSSLAAALAPDSIAEARRLAQENHAIARRSGLPRAVGVALRTLATLEHNDSIDLLRAAVLALEGSSAPLDLARALTDLGAALRRQGHRLEARGPLREALEIAARSGAVPLMERIQIEAVAAGARPRRPRLRGVDALTPSELRVARLAAEGRSNREIAQALFITVKTVADHLGSSYGKLDITSRHQLSTALELSRAQGVIGAGRGAGSVQRTAARVGDA